MLINTGTEGFFLLCACFSSLLRIRDELKFLIIFPRPICPSQIKTHGAKNEIVLPLQ